MLVLFKSCYVCKIEKPHTEFRKSLTYQDGLFHYCISCQKEKQKQRYQNNPKKFIQQTLNWKKKNIQKSKEIQKSLFKNNPIYRIFKTVSKYLKSNNINVKSSIGCSRKELKSHLEKQFTPEMNWDNYGKIWVISRIKGIKEIGRDDLKGLSNINHFSNLRPKLIQN